jgi:hypothetical protein
MSSSHRADRPIGVSSRVRQVDGANHRWLAGNGQLIILPVIIDYVSVTSQGLEELRVEATIDVVNGSLQLIRMDLQAPDGMDTTALQREFRWRTPLDIVERLIPRLMDEGTNPYTVNLPVTRFPEAASGHTRQRGELSDDFLRAIAEEYLRLGRGYAKRIALERNVSPRTVVSWVVKARERGILSAAPGPGAAGGEILTG